MKKFVAILAITGLFASCRDRVVYVNNQPAVAPMAPAYAGGYEILRDEYGNEVVYVNNGTQQFFMAAAVFNALYNSGGWPSVYGRYQSNPSLYYSNSLANQYASYRHVNSYDMSGKRSNTNYWSNADTRAAGWGAVNTKPTVNASGGSAGVAQSKPTVNASGNVPANTVKKSWGQVNTPTVAAPSVTQKPTQNASWGKVTTTPVQAPVTKPTTSSWGSVRQTQSVPVSKPTTSASLGGASKPSWGSVSKPSVSAPVSVPKPSSSTSSWGKKKS